jgi:hypothetical protein
MRRPLACLLVLIVAAPSRAATVIAGRAPSAKGALALGIAAATLLALLQLVAAGAGATPVGLGQPGAPAAKAQALAAYGKLPLAFVANAGQAEERVRYQAQAAGASFSFTPRKAVFAFTRGEKGVALELSFPGANRSPLIEGVGEQPGTHNYLIGKAPAKWQTGLRSYREIVYRELWPGIDLAFRGGGGRLKYELRLAPGADVSDIRLRYRGAERVSLGRARELRIDTALGVLRDSRPVSYQIVGGRRVPVPSGYTLSGSESGYGFSVGAYDLRRPLVIDPGLAYSTFLGGSSSDAGQAIAVDADGNAYVTGRAGASNFPTSVGAFDATFNRGGTDVGSDVFVTKLNAAGSALEYSTFIGGSVGDEGFGIAVDAAGNAVVAGRTDSSNFPSSANAFDGTFNGGLDDAFVTKLDPSGSALVYSTYLGGSLADGGNGIALDPAGNAHVAGQTDSSNFPASPGAADTTLGGGGDAFVTKLDPAGSVLYSSFVGGSSGGEMGKAIAVDAAGNAYVTGFAGLDFPTSVGAFDTTYHGGGDAFVSKLNPTGSALRYSTYIGTSGDDQGFGIAVDADGNAYLTGRTNASSFPTSVGAFDGTFNGGFSDAFVTKLNPAGSALVYSTYLGGSAIDWGRAIAVDAAGSALVTGFTDAANFPTTAGAFDATFNGGFDAFVTRLNAGGSALLDSTFLGGSGFDQAFGTALDAAGNAYVTGSAASDFPTSVGAFDRSGNGGNDAFVAKLTVDTDPPDTTITGGPSGPTNDTTPQFAFSSEPNATFQCRVDDGEWFDCESPHTTGPLGEGEHTFQVHATDQAGNTDPSPASRTFTIDTTPPETTITSGPTGQFEPGPLDLRDQPGPLTNDSTPTFTFTSDSPGSTFECQIDAGEFATCDSPHTTPVLSDGQHTFRVRATDPAANTDPTPATRSFTVTPRCTLVGIVIPIGGTPFTICLNSVRSASTRATSARTPRLTRVTARLTRRGRTYATATRTRRGIARLPLRATRHVTPGTYRLTVTAKTITGRTLYGNARVLLDSTSTEREASR